MFRKITFLIVCAIALSSCEQCNESCPTIPLQYEELGCKPVIPKGKCCPTSFECPDFASYDKTKCHYKGKDYAPGESLSDDLNPRCQPACRCGSGYGDSAPTFVCAHVDCPEFFGGNRPGGPQCVSQYSLDSCCRRNLVCDEKEIKALATCEFEGKSYKEGERINPKKDTCYSCICGKDWDASAPVSKNKHCKKIDCGHELRHLDDIQKGCVPLFYGEDRCCSIEYRCPKKTDSVDAASLRTAGSTDVQCKYGEFTLNVGQEVKTGDKCVKCKCDVPPMVTCAKVANCNN